MRIARIIERLPPVIGGKEIHALELSRALADRGEEQHIFFREGQSPEGLAASRPPRLAGGHTRRRLAGFCLWAHGAVRRQHQRQPFDLIHAHGDFPEASVAAALSRRLRIPAVLSVHGGLSDSGWHNLARLGSVSAMQTVFAVSADVALGLREIGVSAPIVVRPSGVREEFFEAKGAERDQGTVITVGPLAPVKGLETVLEAYDLVQRTRPLRWLVVADGDDDYAAHLRREFARRPGIECFSERNPVRLARLVASACVFVLSSKDQPRQQEGTPTALLEALAAGTPVIASETGALRDARTAPGALSLFRPGDSQGLADEILQRLDSEERTDSEVQTALRPQRWSEVAEEVLAEYENARVEHGREAVCLATPWLETGGAEKLLLDVAREASRAGALPVIAGAPGSLVEEAERDFEYAPLRFGNSLRATVRNTVALAGVAIRRRPSVVNSHQLMTGLAARLGSTIARVPARHVMTFHGVEKAQYTPAVGLLGPYVFDRLLTVSEALRKDAERFTPPGRRKRFGVVHAGIERPPPIDKVDDRVGVIARLVGRKGHRFLLEGWAKVIEEDHATGWVLELWGEGPEHGVLAEQADRLQLGSSIVFSGAVPEAARKVGQFPIVVLPSLREGLPLTILEAMAAGCAVVATDLPGCREIVGDTEAALLVPPADPAALAAGILRLIRDPVLRQRISSAGQARFDDGFSRERMLARYMSELGLDSDGRRPSATQP